MKRESEKHKRMVESVRLREENEKLKKEYRENLERERKAREDAIKKRREIIE